MNEHVVTCPQPMSVRERLGPILFLTLVFFLGFISRIIFSPLMPMIEKEAGISHGQAGSLFLMLAMGFFVSNVLSGFVTSRLTHRNTILLSTVAMGVALLLFSLGSDLMALRLEMAFLGLAFGLYTPSGVAVISALVSHADLGKAMGIHNTAPNLSYILAPLLCQAFLHHIHWQTLLALLGVVVLACAAAFALFQKEGFFHGAAPKPAVVGSLAVRPIFWVMIALFCLGISGSVGIYSVLPMYLVNESGFDLDSANTLLSLSRISGLFMAFFAGWLTDRFGAKTTITGVLFAAGIATLLVAVTTEWREVTMVFLQPAIVACFFPPGFTALSRIVPPSMRSLATGLIIPCGFLFGSGLVPACIGRIAEVWHFSTGIFITGTMIACGSFLAILIKFDRFDEEGC